MGLLVSSRIAAALLLMLANDVMAHGEGGPRPGAADVVPVTQEGASRTIDNLALTIELPRSSPHLQGLPRAVAVESEDGLARLRVPIFSGELGALPVAAVDGAPITLRDLRRTLMPTREEVGSEELSQPVMGTPMEVLGRLVDVWLFAREGKEIGFDELPIVRERVEAFISRTLRERLVEHLVKGIKPNEGEVQRLYEEAVREWRIKAMIFKIEVDAISFRTAVESGANFDDAARKYIEEGKATAKGGAEGEYIGRKDMPPEMGQKIGEYTAGSVLPATNVEGGFGVIQLLEIRLREDPEAKSQAKRRALNFSQNKFLEEYNLNLMEKYVKVDKELLEELNLREGVENFERLLRDERTVAIIQDESPVRVADLTRGINEKFYHGIGQAIEQDKLTPLKFPVLNEILRKRVFLKEARAQGLDNVPEFLDDVAYYENSEIFNVFFQKVLRPEVKIIRMDLQESYQQHIEQYTVPEMIRLRSLAFVSASAAQAALDKLNKGTDYLWVKANADGQVPAGTQGVTDFSEGFVTMRSVPEAVRQAVTKKGEDDYVLYNHEGKYFHVLNVVKRVPPIVKPLDEVQREVLQQVYKEKIDMAFKDWKHRLMKVYDVKVYAKE